MLRWLFLAAGVAAFATMLVVGSQLAVVLAFSVLFANFATMCVQYNGPIDRARARMTASLRTLQPHSDAHQRLQTARITPTIADRRHPLTTLTVLNLASGIACISMLAWGLALWMT
jgi:high-affinity K+ transport system ATPase subunit B